MNSHFSNCESLEKEVKLKLAETSSLLRTRQKNVEFIPGFIPRETILVSGDHKQTAKFRAYLIFELHLTTLRMEGESREVGTWTRHITAACLPEDHEKYSYSSL